MAERAPRRRCAIYTRKSTEEGLDQAYNSLDAQRDACSAYIASQKHEGWVAIETHYDDGGFSGGSLERPALKALFADLAAGKVDIIVVYKIDRLTRSLADFAKLTELFDKHNVSFVAVTQQFNTSTSMGRLTLNVLLSFAQFEREVAGERIRDKIAASKRRGMWMGGRTPLGYDVRDKKLVVNPEEAGTVRHIFRRYLELKSVRLLQQDLERSDIRSKRRITRDGREQGGCIMLRGALSSLLTSQTYRGLIKQGGMLHQGEHERIVPEDLFQAVQATLAGQGPGEAARLKRASPALLKGLVFDAAGNRLQPTHCKKHGRTYHYYVSAPRLRDAKANPQGLRVPAPDLERIVTQTMATRLRDHPWLSKVFAATTHIASFAGLSQLAQDLATEIASQSHQKTDLLRSIIRRVTVDRKQITVSIDLVALHRKIAATDIPSNEIAHEAGFHDLVIAGQFLRCGKEVRLVIDNTTGSQDRIDRRLVREIIQARRWYADLVTGRASGIADLARRSGCNPSYVSRKITLALLAPDLVEMILQGKQPPTFTPEQLKRACPLPVSWDEQRTVLLA